MNPPFTKRDLFDYRDLLEREIGIKIVEKKTSRFMKFLAVLLFFNKGFLNGYITTIGRTIYWPDMENNFGSSPARNAATLAHECQHASDGRVLPIFYELAYINPQISALLALLSLLSFWSSPYWAIAVLFLLLLTPIPSLGRMLIEMRANGAGMAFWIWYKGGLEESWLNGRVAMFTKAGYYFMWPFRKDILRRLAKTEASIRAGNLTSIQRTTYEFLVGRGLVKD